MIRRRRLDAVAGPLDQVLYSLSNAIPIIAMSRVLPADDFGRAALTMAAVSTVLVLNRAWTGLHFLIHDSTYYRNGAVGFAAIVGILGSATGVGSWFALGNPTALEVSIGLAVPALLVQDVLRHRLLSLAKHSELLFAEAAWVAIEVAILGAALILDRGVALSAALSWGIGALGSAFFAEKFVWSNQDGSVYDVKGWAISSKATSAALSVDASLSLLRSHGFLALLALSGGVSLVGSYRLATTIAAPIYTVILGWRNTAIVRIRLASGVPNGLFVVPTVAALAGVVIASATPSSIRELLAGTTGANLLWSAVAVAAALAAIDSLCQASLLATGSVATLARTRIAITALWLATWATWQPTDENALDDLLLWLALLSTAIWISVGYRHRSKLDAPDPD